MTNSSCLHRKTASTSHKSGKSVRPGTQVLSTVPITTFTFDLSSYISANTTIRFSVGDNVDDGDVVYVDNFKVGYTTGTSAQNITVNYTENSAVGLSGQVTDVDDTTMAAAAIAVTNAKAGDSLSLTNLAALAALGISVGPGSDATHINLIGAASKANYAAALGLIVFSNSSDNPDTSDRTIAVTVTDVQGGVSNAATTTVHVTAVDDAPVVWAPDLDVLCGNAEQRQHSAECIEVRRCGYRRGRDRHDIVE